MVLHWGGGARRLPIRRKQQSSLPFLEMVISYADKVYVKSLIEQTFPTHPLDLL